MNNENIKLSTNASYKMIVEEINTLYSYPLSEKEAKKAANNLIGFCKTLLEIKQENCKNHD